MKIIFLGTPEFAIPSLKKLMASKHEILAIVSQPDKEQDRGKKIKFSPVKQFAIENNLPIYQFEKISRDGVKPIKELKPDIIITAAYGQIISQEIIDIPKYGIINIHGSLLPKFRGASPVQTAIIEGEEETGITIMQTEAGLDTGDIIFVLKTNIDPNETAGELMDRLALISADAIIEALDLIENHKVLYRKQSYLESTVTSKLTKESGRIFWSRDAVQIKNQILGQNPFPIAFSYLNGTLVKIYRACLIDEVASTNKEPGTVIEPTSAKNGVFVQCGHNIIKILEMQFPGSKVLSGSNCINGRKIKIGDVFEIDDKIVREPTILKPNK